jgi:membrane peptidoglycan carboxypeptidase
VPTASGDGQLAAETIGQRVRVSPLAMALVAGAVQSGAWRPPVLVTSPPDGSRTAKESLAPGAMSSLRDLMRKAVTSGSAQPADVPGAPVFGQAAQIRTGTAAHPAWQSWFVGYRGDVAFAVLESDWSPQVSAPALAAQFLAALQSG